VKFPIGGIVRERENAGLGKVQVRTWWNSKTNSI